MYMLPSMWGRRLASNDARASPIIHPSDYLRPPSFFFRQPTVYYRHLLINQPVQALDLMEKCLTFSPKRRIEVGEALAHPYLSVRVSPLPFLSCLFFLCFDLPRFLL
jgi:serine/threonine protein kinase